MIKVPKVDYDLSSAYVDERSQLLHDYGALLAHWAEFELTIEVKIAKIVGLRALDASIILGGVNFGLKQNILFSLLHERGQNEVVDRVKAVVNHAKRNALVHGLADALPEVSQFCFFKREIGSSYQVKKLHYTASSFNEHFERLRVLVWQAFNAMELSAEDIHNYAQEANLNLSKSA